MFVRYECCKNKKKELEYSVSSKGASETESFGWHLFFFFSPTSDIVLAQDVICRAQEHRENEVFERALYQ